MRKVLVSGVVSAVALIIFSALALYATIWFLPNLALEYYDPVFRENGRGEILYFLHPIILSFALAWFWERFKPVFTGSFTMRGIEFGLVYLLVATLPSMWIIYSAMSVTAVLVISWLIYGFIQALVAGLIFEKLNP